MKKLNYSTVNNSTVITTDSSFISCLIYRPSSNTIQVVIKDKVYSYSCIYNDYLDFYNFLYVSKSLGKTFNLIKKKLNRIS